MITHDNIQDILKALGNQIGFHRGSPIAIVVCGGTALFALGLISRTTMDVDVLCEVIEGKSGIKLKAIDELPSSFEKAAEVVRRDFGLPENWINIGPALQFESGLPEGFKERLIRREYGEYLTVYFISRLDQIHFKLYASLDRGGYHVDDLFALGPASDEMGMAASWVLTQDVSEGFKIILKDFLKRKGYNEIAQRV